jgi:glycogen synthase
MRNLPPLPEKVLMTADTVGGVWDYSLELIRGLRPHGVRVALATMGGPLTADQRKAAAAIGNLELFESCYRLEWMDDPWDDLRKCGEWLLRLEEELTPDLVHLNGYAHGSLPWSSPVAVIGHSCVLSWWKAVKREPAPPRWERYRAAVAEGLACADAVVAPSGAMLASLEEHYPPLPHGRFIHNGRSRKAFRPGRKENLLLCVGRLWDDAKNVAAAARAAERIAWPLCVAGESRRPDGAETEIGGVHPLGRLSPPLLASWYRRAAIYVLPARYEPFGLSVLEAALSGCALVIGDIPSFRELWEGAALFVDPENPEMLRETLERLTRDPVLRLRLSAAARVRGLSFTTEKMTACYLDLYGELMAKRRSLIPLCRKGA